jgi:hypothetical protein
MVLQESGADLPALPTLNVTTFPPALARAARGNRQWGAPRAGSTLLKASYLGLSAFASRFAINHSSASRATE